jgi:hypothetical protein
MCLVTRMLLHYEPSAMASGKSDEDVNRARWIVAICRRPLSALWGAGLSRAVSERQQG